MKKITFLMILFITTMAFGQQQQYLFDFEPGDPDGVASNWITFDNSPPPATIIDNPDLDGTNAVASKVLRVEMGPGNAFYAGVNNLWQNSAFGTWKIDAAVSSNLTVSMDINKNYVGTVGIKMSTNTGATTFEITNQNVGNTIVNEWQTLTWTIPSIPATLETNISQFVVFVDWTQGMPDRAPGSIIHIDNIRFNAEKLTNAPTCTDGIQNGGETGVDCGGPSCAPCTGQSPITNATVPPARNASDVISIYGGAYTNIPVANYDPNWGQTGHTLVNTAFDPGTGDLVMNYPSFNYQGTDFGSNVNASAMEFLHVDVWTANAVDLKVSPINNNAGTGVGEILVSVPVIAGQWSSVDLPKSAFTGMTWDALFQMKFERFGTSNPSNIFLDNIYFWKAATASNDDVKLNVFNAYPNPSKGSWTINSVDTVIESVQVYDFTGKLVLNQSSTATSLQLDGSSLANGMYIARIASANGVQNLKLIKD